MESLRQLKDIEKAVITWGYYNGVKQWAVMYDMFHPSNVAPSTKTTNVSKWKHDPAVQKFWEELRISDELRVQQLVQIELKKIEKNNGTATLPVGSVDFTDVAQLIAFLNSQANTIPDERDRREYLKMLTDLLRLKENSQDKEQDIQRFYVPLTCRECPLHQKEEEELQKEKRGK